MEGALKTHKNSENLLGSKYNLNKEPTVKKTVKLNVKDDDDDDMYDKNNENDTENNNPNSEKKEKTEEKSDNDKNTKKNSNNNNNKDDDDLEYTGIRFPSIENIHIVKSPELIVYGNKNLNGCSILNDRTGELWCPPSNSSLAQKIEKILINNNPKVFNKYLKNNQSYDNSSNNNSESFTGSTANLYKTQSNNNNIETNNRDEKIRNDQLGSNIILNFDKYISDVQKLLGRSKK